MPERKKIIKIIDGAIAIFFVLFLLTLTNSIFFNQLGYYGALLLLIFRYFITKENQFPGTGLEFAFLWFILAEFLTALFSDYQAASYTNAVKRAVLFPLVYTTAAAANTRLKAKTYFKIYIGISLTTVLIYLYYAYYYLIKDLYQLKESGPSIFQYPITASEIISFTVVFLFAFLINEKSSWRTRIALLVALALSVLALISTYKRTGWLGTAFGIFIILLIRKEWKYIIPGIILVLLFFFLEKDFSVVKIYKQTAAGIEEVRSFETEGRAYDVLPAGDQYFISDFQNGILVYNDTALISRFEAPSPVMSVRLWKDNIYAAILLDTRFMIIRYSNNKFSKVNEFTSPGLTYSHTISNNFLYVLDKDSGLTVFKDPYDPASRVRYPGITGNYIAADDSNMVIYAPEFGLDVYKLENSLPLLESKMNNQLNTEFAYYTEGYLFASNTEGLKLYKIEKGKLRLLQETSKASNTNRWIKTDENIFAAGISGNIYSLSDPANDGIRIISEGDLGFPPNSFNVSGNTIYSSHVKRSRFLSIFDPNHPSNTSRLALWRAGFRMFKDHPFFGVGDIDLTEVYKKYKNYYDKELQGHLHNNFFHILATLGAFGLLAVCFLFYRILRIDFDIYKKTLNAPFVNSYALGAFGAFCAFLFSGLTELNFGDHEILTLVLFTFGLNLSLFYSTRLGTLRE